MIDDVSLWSKLESTHSILLVPIEQIDDIQDVSARIVGGKVNLLETGGVVRPLRPPLLATGTGLSMAKQLQKFTATKIMNKSERNRKNS